MKIEVIIKPVGAHNPTTEVTTYVLDTATLNVPEQDSRADQLAHINTELEPLLLDLGMVNTGDGGPWYAYRMAEDEWWAARTDVEACRTFKAATGIEVEDTLAAIESPADLDSQLDPPVPLGGGDYALTWRGLLAWWVETHPDRDESDHPRPGLLAAFDR